MSDVVDVGELLSTRLGDGKRPPAPPTGEYHGQIMSWEATRGRFASKVESGEKERVIRFRVKLKEASSSIAPEQLEGVVVDGTFMSWDVSIDQGTYRLEEAMRKLGFENGSGTLMELLPQTVGLPVLAKIKTTPSTKEVGSFFSDIVGAVKDD